MSGISYTEVVEHVRGVFETGRTKELAWRKEQLRALIRFFDEQGRGLSDCLKKDLNKPLMEAQAMEIVLTRNEAVKALETVEKWAKPRKVEQNLLTMMDTCYQRPEPYGIVLILGAWNYPVQLTMLPMIGAIAAGNCVILKPSEISEATAAFLEKTLPMYMDKDCVRVINGGVNETTALLRERFDYIFYTGNNVIGKIVMTAAAQHLTPITLELGGKSPCYVDRSSDVKVAARRVAWGKFINCGQTCIAPDYVLVNSDIKQEFVDHVKSALKEFYGENPKESSNYGRIVNNRHFNRIKQLLDSGKVAFGADLDDKINYISPTLLVDVNPTDKVMQEEIFGPVLPIMVADNEDAAIKFINSREKPLALYVFSKNKTQINRLIAQTSSGGVCINDCLMHCSLDTLPFGGVGPSGMGAYHGKASFETFSHMKSCMIKSQGMEGLNKIRYPPYSDKKMKQFMWLLRKDPSKGGFLRRFMFPIILLGVVAFAIFLGVRQN